MARGNTTAIVITTVLLLGVGLTVAVAAAGSPKKKPAPDVPAPDVPDDAPVPDEPKPDEPEPEPDKQPDKQPPPPPPGTLVFDLETNWGNAPLHLRSWLARLELASGIPGIARALYVKWWQAFRAGQPLVSPQEAVAIAAQNIDLCRNCLNPLDGPDSKDRLDKNIALGWKKPADYEGWAKGSYGLGDILGANFPWAGIHTSPGFLPLLNLPAQSTARDYIAQMYVAANMIRQILFSENYSVLRPGPNASPGDPYNTWGNIFSVWASPDQYVKGQGEDEKQRYLDRAAEAGIDLSKVAFPWPPGKKYDSKSWTAKDVWTRLQDYKNKTVVHMQPKSLPGPALQVDLKSVPLQLLGDGLSARVIAQGFAGDEPAPLVVVLHGRDADEFQMQGYIPPELTARVAFLRGNLAAPNGRLFFEPRLSDPEAVLVPAMKTALGQITRAIAQLLAKYPKTTRVVVLGGSQGAALAYGLGVLGAVDGVVALAGSLPPALRPAYPAATTIHGIHGDADLTVPWSAGKATVDAFKAAGYIFTQFTSVAGGVHNIKTGAAAQVRAALIAAAEDFFLPDGIGMSTDPECKIVLDSLPEAAWSLSTGALGIAQAQDATLDQSALAELLTQTRRNLLPNCNGGLGVVQASARDLYLAARAALRALLYRGFTTAPAAAVIATTVRDEAMALGVPAQAMPGLEVGP